MLNKHGLHWYLANDLYFSFAWSKEKKQKKNQGSTLCFCPPEADEIFSALKLLQKRWSPRQARSFRFCLTRFLSRKKPHKVRPNMQRIIFYGAKGTRLTLPGFLDEKNAAPQLRGKNWLAPNLWGDPPIFSIFLKAKKLRPVGSKG